LNVNENIDHKIDTSIFNIPLSYLPLDVNLYLEHGHKQE
jgi:hypothetical protein